MSQAADHSGSQSFRPLAAHEFEQVRKLAHQAFGLDLKPGKEDLVVARLGRILRNGRFRSFREYCNHVLADSSGAALETMIDALATNHTAFLRETEHFEFLRRVAPELAARDTVEVWSAACATGEEVWTLACLLNEALPLKNILIEASDISQKALRFAERAEYSVERCGALPAAWLMRHFERGRTRPDIFRVGAGLRSQVRFRRLNLLDPFPWTRPFPLIFCRNVMIYFDAGTQEKVVRKLAASLEPGGYLFVGHAESLTRISHDLEFVQPAVYRKPGKKESRWSRL